METCRTCKFASIMRQQCRRNAPQAVPVPYEGSLVPFTFFPSLPKMGDGCGQHEPVDAAEAARRDVEHPVTVREVP